MKHLIRSIYLIICLLPLSGAAAQELSFATTSFNFGTIAEEGGEVLTKFTATNSGEQPVVIVTAKSSCGCTIPHYSRKPIAAGESTTIEVRFDPANRPGLFTKSVEVITAPDSRRYSLTISGDVTPRERTQEELYPFNMGSGLRIGANYYPMGQVEQGERLTTQLKYVNTSKKEVKFKTSALATSGLIEAKFPTSIAAGESGVVEISYDLEHNRGHYGALTDRLAVVVNGKESPYNIIVNGHAIDAFGEEEREAPPIFNCSTHIIKCGEMQRSRSPERESFVIENSGINPLIIRAVDLGEGVHSSLKAGDSVAAGESMSVEVWVDSSHFELGNFSRYLTMTINDPDQPSYRVRVTGIVIGEF